MDSKKVGFRGISELGEKKKVHSRPRVTPYENKSLVILPKPDSVHAAKPDFTMYIYLFMYVFLPIFGIIFFSGLLKAICMSLPIFAIGLLFLPNLSCIIFFASLGAIFAFFGHWILSVFFVLLAGAGVMQNLIGLFSDN